MAEIVSPGCPGFRAPCESERHCHPDHEHKSRLNHVPKHRSFPRNMVEPSRNSAPSWIVLEERETETFRRKQQHNETAISIQRDKPSRLYLRLRHVVP